MAFNLENILGPIQGIAGQEHPAREAVAQLYAFSISKIIGERPDIKRYDDYTLIDWKPGQAKKMEKYLTSVFLPGPAKAKEPPPAYGFSFSEVKLNFKPVFIPLMLKTIVPILAIYGIGAFALGRISK